MADRMVPVLNGRIEEFGCVYVIVPKVQRTPCLIGYCSDVDRTFRKIQALNYTELKLDRVFYVADANLARRVVESVMGAPVPVVRGNWLNWSTVATVGTIESAARALSIPLYTQAQYHSLCRPRQQAIAEVVAKRAGFR